VQPKIVITGTGRAGTTLLVRVLGALGLDTGEQSGVLVGVDQRTHGGLECLLGDPRAPRVVKDLTLAPRLEDLLRRNVVSVEHVIIPMRRLDLAVASRVRASDYGRNIFAKGGLTGTGNPTRQKQALAYVFYELMRTIAMYEIPHTLLEFPRFADDAEYLHRNLAFLAPDHTEADFTRILAEVYRAELVHETVLTPHERRSARIQAMRLKFTKQGRIPDWQPPGSDG
jgi:hypothetical protein